MPSPLALSPAGGSAWSASLFLECPRKFKLRYIDGLRRNVVAQPLWLGDVIHSACLIDHLERRLPVADIAQRLRAAIASRMTGEETGGVTYERKDSQEVVTALALRMVETFCHEEIDVVQVEVPFATPLIDPRDGSIVEGVIVKGKIDLIERCHIEETVVDNHAIYRKMSGTTTTAVIDLKTSSSRLDSLVPHLFQLHTYAYLHFLRHQHIPFLGVYNLTKAKVPTLQKVFSKPTLADVVTAFETLRTISERFKRREFEKNLTQCRNKYHQDCEFLSICNPSMFDVVDIEVDRKLISKGTKV